MRFAQQLGIIVAFLLQLLPTVADDVITNIVSPIISFQVPDNFDSQAMTNGGIASPIFSYQYCEWPGEEILPLLESPHASYFYNSGNRPALTLVSPSPLAAAALAFNFSTDFGESYIFEYKKVLSEPFWKVWRLIVGDGQVKSIIEEIKASQSLFVRVRTEVNPIRFKFPLQGGFSPERISGYHHGDHWLNRYCLDAGNSGNRLLHIGVDFGASASDTVYAVSAGSVKYARTDATWGGYLVLEAENGYTITYTHVIPSVLSGTVSKGAVIGTIALGNENFDSHLHFQVRNKAFSSGELTIELRGRLPENNSCVTVIGEEPDPAFPESFLDPETIFWE